MGHFKNLRWLADKDDRCSLLVVLVVGLSQICVIGWVMPNKMLGGSRSDVLPLLLLGSAFVIGVMCVGVHRVLRAQLLVVDDCVQVRNFFSNHLIPLSSINDARLIAVDVRQAEWLGITRINQRSVVCRSLSTIEIQATVAKLEEHGIEVFRFDFHLKTGDDWDREIFDHDSTSSLTK